MWFRKRALVRKEFKLYQIVEERNRATGATRFHIRWGFFSERKDGTVFPDGFDPYLKTGPYPYQIITKRSPREVAYFSSYQQALAKVKELVASESWRPVATLDNIGPAFFEELEKQ